MNNVPNIELCKKLKELGYDQKIPYSGMRSYFYEEGDKVYVNDIVEIAHYFGGIDGIIYAPTVMEMIDILPESIGKYSFKMEKYDEGDYSVCWEEEYYSTCSDPDYIGGKCGKNLPDTLAETIIRCIENKYLDFKSDNQNIAENKQ